jgi:hypothetical protein
MHAALIELVKNAKYNLDIEAKRLGKPAYMPEGKLKEFLKSCGMDLTAS